MNQPPIKLYNTMSRQIEEFKPLDDVVTVYTCGPTVYDYPHIGNWYAFIRWDILNRMLLASGYKTNWVMNITDVGHLVSDADEGEDKLEKGAKREGKTAWEIAKYYSDYFVEGLKRLNFTEPTVLPKATDYINEQIEFVQKLEAKGFTYTITDGVYFDTAKFNDYGKLAKLNLGSQLEGARVNVNPEKRNPSDFALWKFSPKGQQRDMEWDSPWGKGFPGWHLECSALALKFLGETIDIHGGGIDHIPVHHTNEIAQSESANGKTFANYWLHSNFIQVNSQKMSKSLGNLITLEDIEAKGYSLEAFRLLVLESHYRSEAQFTWDTMDAAQNRLNNYKALSQLRYQLRNEEIEFSPNQDSLVLNALKDDLNTPLALSVLSRTAEITLIDGISTNHSSEFTAFIESIDKMLGLKLMAEADITNEQKTLIMQREEARTTKDWARSDEVRDQLKEQGIELRDTAHGTIWQRV